MSLRASTRKIAANTRRFRLLKPFKVGPAIAFLMLSFGAAQHPTGATKDSAKISSELLAGNRSQTERLAGWLVVGLDSTVVEVDIRLGRLDSPILASLQKKGLKPLRAYPQFGRVVGRCHRRDLEQIAALEEVLSIHPNQSALTMGGSCGTATGHAANLENTRKHFGVSGKGVRVGIISDSFRSRYELGEAGRVSGQGCQRVLMNSRPQLEGELPAVVHLVTDGMPDGGDEGRAMAEIIHDLAPKAEIYFHGGGESIPAMAEAIDHLVECGVDIIVDDLFFSREPMFQDGIIAQAVHRAVQPAPNRLARRRPVAYFTSAGNQGRFGVMDSYRDFAPSADEMDLPPTGLDFHNFGTGRFLPITMPPGCGIGAVLQWDEGFGAARTDLDLYLCSDPVPDSCMTSSAAAQGCGAGAMGGDPIEVVTSIINISGRENTLYLAVDHFCGEQVDFRIATFPQRGCEVNRGSSNDDEKNQIIFGQSSQEREVFNKPQIYGHANAVGAAAVAAIPFDELSDDRAILPQGVFNLEEFSSLGGDLPIRFGPNSEELPEAEVRRQPKFTAPDRSETSFFGSSTDIFGSFNRNGCNEFAGTSASAPYAAGIAALMLDLDPHLEPDQLIKILQSTALPIGEEERAGAGVIQADKALQRIQRMIRLARPPGPHIRP